MGEGEGEAGEADKLDCSDVTVLLSDWATDWAVLDCSGDVTVLLSGATAAPV